MGIPPAQPQLQLMERGICSPVQPWPFGAFFSLPWAGAGIPGDWRSPSKRRNCRTQGNKDRERALCDPACLQSSAVLQLPREESQMERLAEQELQDLHQLSQALTLHSLSHCCSFSPLFVQRERPKNCAKVTVSCQGTRAACPGAPARKR